MERPLKKIVLVAMLIMSAGWVSAKVRLPALFSCGMVLQQGVRIPVWGWGVAGESVEVCFGTQVQKTKVDAAGKWMLHLHPEQASAESRILKIQVGAEVNEITNVLVGEVWICSGQSNMDFELGKLCNRKLRTKASKPIVDYMKKMLTTADDPLFRQIAVPHLVSVWNEKEDFVGHWITSSPENNTDFSATAYFFGLELRRELQVPVGLIKCAWGGTRVEAWIPMEAYRKTESLKDYYEAEMTSLNRRLEQWGNPQKAQAKYDAELAKWKGKTEGMKKKPRKPRKRDNPKTNKQLPAGLYNGMIHPLIPFAFKGVIWYQGESNEHYFPKEYSKRFMAAIQGWRNAWGRGDFPFYYVQLANYHAPHNNPDESSLAFICNQQRLALALKNTGMAVINDIGEAKDIHPKNKIDVGKRLARLALSRDYGRSDIVGSGPLYQSHTIEGSKIIISFSSVGDGLMTGKKKLLDSVVETDELPGGFQIRGIDRKWRWGDAKIVDKNKVEVSCADIEHPTAVRYAWASNPTNANLYNKEGLPTSVFTTE